MEELEETLAGTAILLPSHRIMPEHDDVSFQLSFERWKADNQLVLTILQRTTVYHLQQLLPHDNLLLGSVRPSWLLHR